MASSYTITCTACGAANRVPADKEGLSGRCGNCRATLPALYTTPLTLGDHSFDDFVKNYQGPVLAEFWAPW